MARPKGLPKTGGKPKGYKAPSTLKKEAARAHYYARITAELDPLIDCQIALAKSGDARMLVSLMDRLFDRPREHVEVSGPGWQPLFALPAGVQPSVKSTKE